MIIDITGKLVIDHRTREWCLLPYPGHPVGCPNFNVAEQCPSKISMIGQNFDLSKKHLIVVHRFDMKSHVEKMKEKHSDWSDKQLRCCLYWQNTVRKELRKECEIAIQQLKLETDDFFPKIEFTLLPEAMSVNVFRTCYNVGIKIQKNPIDVIHKVAFVGFALS